jgi:hypothetical protein
MAEIQVIHSGAYHHWPESPRIIVISDRLAEALDNLLEACDDVAHGHSHDMDIGPALERVRRLHDWRTVRIGGELIVPALDPPAVGTEGG